MASIGLVRIDGRLLHGQVVTKWIQESKSDRVIIIDNKLVNDDFLRDVFLMAAPPGINVEVKSTKQAADEWKKDQFGDGKILVLFKDPDNVSASLNAGFHINRLQVANMGSAPGKKLVYKTVSMNEQDAQILQSIRKSGVDVYFQSLPDDREVGLQYVLKKHYQNLM
ncbi:MAG: PTS system mannose/fructose/N-acetylgalactosamine-transporter subunit IIB [Sporolactobacillus sp.]